MNFIAPPPAPPKSRRRPLWRRESGWGARAFLIAATLVGWVTVGYAGNFAKRNALWAVVNACVLDQAKTGSPLPCLEVSAADGGYTVLRPPVGRPDTILTPTQRIVGIEDPRLQAPNAPNYFALAWAERRWLQSAPPDERVALAVNSRLARSQDQLHIHIGCLDRRFAQRLRDGALGPATGVWFRAADMGRGLELWTYRSGTTDWRGLEPFRLLKSLVGDPERALTHDARGSHAQRRNRPGGGALPPRRLVRRRRGHDRQAVLIALAPLRAHPDRARQEHPFNRALLHEQADFDVVVRV